MDFKLLYEKIELCKKIGDGFCMFKKMGILSKYIILEDGHVFDKKEFKKSLQAQGYRVVSDFLFFVVEWDE